MSTTGVGGRFDFDDGGSYAGDWTDGMAHGYGVCTGPGGEGEFAGAWQLGFETSGVYRAAATGAVYEGQWLQGRRHGLGVDSRGLPGTTTVPGGPRWMYRGEWTQGFRGRYGVRQSTATGTKYEGTWTAGLQDGYGVETYADGGTFQGQWLRGVRHGYGVRQSVSYDLAARYPVHPVFPSVQLPVPGFTPPEKEDDVLLRERDMRIEETRGGFVLVARTTPPDPDSISGSHKHRMVLDKYGKPSIRKTIVKMMRQRSAGDVRESATTSRSSSRMSGSVRSTSSQSSYASTGTTTTGHGSVYSDEGSEASFVSHADLPQDAFGLEIVERYLGEWKGDRRAGYGVAERSDGLRYEGEWASNRKHGYGVTTLRDGTRIEGKYKNNILVASASGGKGSSKLFTLRSGKLRDRVEAAVKAALRAADVAKQKAEIACARMLSARMKAEQVEDAARRAVTDAELAKAKAREYSPTASQPGSNIIANRPTQETEMRSEFDSHLDGFDNSNVGLPAAQTQSSPTKLFSFFKAKKTSSAAISVRSDLSAPPAIAPHSSTSTLPAGRNLQSDSRQNLPTGFQSGSPQSVGGGSVQNWNATMDARNRSGNGGVPQRSGFTAQQQQPGYRNGGGPQQLETATRYQQSYASSPPGPSGFYISDRVSVTGQPQIQVAPSYSSYSQNGPEYFQSNTAPGFDDSSTTSPGGYLRLNSGGGGGGFENFGTGGGSATSASIYREPSFYAHGDVGPVEAVAAATVAVTPAVLGSGYDVRPSYIQQQQQQQQQQQRSFDDGLMAPRPAIGERRQSLPSIVKQKTELTTLTAGRPLAGRAAQRPVAPAATAKSPGGAEVPARRPQIDTFVIENGVRKRVKPIYGDDTTRQSSTSAGSPSSPSVSGPSPLAVASAAMKSKRRVFTLEAPRRAEMGSVPDVSAVSSNEILPREVVAVLSQRRREELILQRAEEERRRRNQIVLCFGDLKDWCQRRRVLVLLIVVNISLASLFYNLLNQ